jgi:hypothetical protein
MKNNKNNKKKIDKLIKNNGQFLNNKKRFVLVGGRRSDLSINKQYAANG